MLTEKQLYQGQPTAAEQTIFIVGSGAKGAGLTRVRRFSVVVANVSNADAQVFLSHVPNGGVAGDGNRIIPGEKIPALSSQHFTFEHPLEIGDFLSAKNGTAAAITLTISGVTE